MKQNILIWNGFTLLSPRDIFKKTFDTQQAKEWSCYRPVPWAEHHSKTVSCCNFGIYTSEKSQPFESLLHVYFFYPFLPNC